MNLRLYELVEIPNNSRITADILYYLNNKLSKEEIRDFRIWLRIIKNK